MQNVTEKQRKNKYSIIKVNTIKGEQMYSLTLKAKDIPDKSKVTKVNGVTEYILLKDLKVYTTEGYDVKNQAHIQNGRISLPHLHFLVNNGDIEGIDVNKELSIHFKYIVDIYTFVEELYKKENNNLYA